MVKLVVQQLGPPTPRQWYDSRNFLAAAKAEVGALQPFGKIGWVCGYPSCYEKQIVWDPGVRIVSAWGQAEVQGGENATVSGLGFEHWVVAQPSNVEALKRKATATEQGIKEHLNGLSLGSSSSYILVWALKLATGAAVEFCRLSAPLLVAGTGTFMEVKIKNQKKVVGAGERSGGRRGQGRAAEAAAPRKASPAAGRGVGRRYSRDSSGAGGVAAVGPPRPAWVRAGSQRGRRGRPLLQRGVALAGRCSCCTWARLSAGLGGKGQTEAVMRGGTRRGLAGRGVRRWRRFTGGKLMVRRRRWPSKEFARQVLLALEILNVNICNHILINSKMRRLVEGLCIDSVEEDLAVDWP
ncbi:hypothetical protein E2562_027039 [Oryza meyeriana var. granulata]|uniref:Uncharacterized protein n=1 Tax=Oryza meyeriana var. granulata TaxID=110450 RepID=A0A6G1CA63_9ORYZ|nr:hypothetical protein E2562_027039 [Oryza meyeriana var. granulata]